MNIEEIQALIPHRYPFLLIDRILEMVPGQRGRGLKNVTINEPFFPGHFPGRPIMPGVLLLEAMAQVAVVIMLSLEENRGKTAYFASLDKVRFRKPVVPGDCFITDVEVLWQRGTFGKVKGIGTVDGTVVVEAELGYTLVLADHDPTRRSA
jgi:3-hydroxyacyl-[acyl-carrier-protein] dehydratase